MFGGFISAELGKCSLSLPQRDLSRSCPKIVGQCSPSRCHASSEFWYVLPNTSRSSRLRKTDVGADLFSLSFRWGAATMNLGEFFKTIQNPNHK